jgi:glycosyl transferase family 25
MLDMPTGATIPCYLINLAGAPERLAHMTRVFTAANIAFERFEAIDTVAMTAHPAFHRIPPQRGRDWGKGELACLISHYELWQRIAAGNAPFAAIFEDDAHFDPRLRDVLEAPELLPPDAAAIKLETFNTPLYLGRKTWRGPAGVTYARLMSIHHGNAAYIISNQGAAYLVRSLGLFDMPIDDSMFGAHHPVGRGLRTYQCVPALAIQDMNLPPGQQVLALQSTVGPMRDAVRLQSAIRAESQTKFRLQNFPLRLIRAASRRLRWRYRRVPYGPNGSSGGAVL